MSILVAALCLHRTTHLSRIEFVHRLRAVNRGMTFAEVRARLGDPDDVSPLPYEKWRLDDGNVEWRYGTRGHGTLATLGVVSFQDGQVDRKVGSFGEPPAPWVISDAELDRALRTMNVERGEMESAIPAMRIANALIPLGARKAIAALLEYSRVMDERRYEDLIVAIRLMFRSKAPNEHPLPEYTGNLTPKPPQDRAEWPDYPYIVADDVPFFVVSEGAFAGGGPALVGQIRRAGRFWQFRNSPLRPPTDPFTIIDEVRRRPEWKLSGGAPQGDDPQGDNWLIERQIRMVIRPVTGDGAGGTAEARATFFRLGGHWDPALGMYVRGDGSYLKRPQPSPEYRRSFPGLPGLRAMLSFRRDGNVVRWTATLWELHSRPLKLASLHLIRMRTRAESALCLLTAPEVERPSRNYYAPHSSYGVIRSTPREPIRFMVQCDGRRFYSPVYRP